MRVDRRCLLASFAEDVPTTSQDVAAAQLWLEFVAGCRVPALRLLASAPRCVGKGAISDTV